MRTQYTYNPPPGGTSEWITKLKPLIEPPTCYLTFLAGIALAVFLYATSGSRYAIHILILLIALPFHELGHAIVADRLGDPTPRNHGHLTLNPFAQLNFLGSLLVLLFGLGWAYVPINPSYLRPNPRTGHMIVAVAGPLATLLLAVLTAILWHIISPVLQMVGGPTLWDGMLRLFFFFSLINTALFFFNLLPLAPLDGFFVLRGLLPESAAYQLERLQPYSMMIFLAIFLLPFLTGGMIDIVGPFIFYPAQVITSLLFGAF